jgi:hypothetical protein
MVLIEPSYVFLDEMVCNQDDHLAFELQSFPGVSKIAIGVGTLLSLASEIGTKLFGHILWEDVRWVDGWVPEVKHTQILLLFGGSVNLFLHNGAYFASDDRKGFPCVYWVLWDCAYLRYAVWV